MMLKLMSIISAIGLSLYLKQLLNENNNSIFERLIALYKNMKPPETGDVYLCKDIKTGENVHIKAKDRFLHMLILGPTGSGKSSLVLLPLIKQDIENDAVGITVIDPKGDLAEMVIGLAELSGRRALYFNPAMKTCPKFNPLEGREDEVVENMVLVFRMLLAESPDFYKDTVEKLLRVSLKLLKRVKANPTLIDLENLLSDNNGIGMQYIANLQEKNKCIENKALYHENANIIQFMVTEYFDSKSEVYVQTSSLRTQLSRLNDNKHLRNVLNPSNGKGEVDFSKALDEGHVIAITTAQGILNQTLSRLLGLFLIINFQSAVMKRSGDEHTRRPHFLYIDEFQEYANPAFAVMLTQGRSYRVSSVLATQNRQLISGDGKSEGLIFLDLVSANARNIVLLPDLPYMDADYYSKDFGTRKIKKYSHSKSSDRQSYTYSSHSKSYSIEEQAILTATEISQQAFGTITYKLIENGSARKASIGEVTFVDELTLKAAKHIIEVNKRLDNAGLKANSIPLEIKLSNKIDSIIAESAELDQL